ncbi:MAG: thiamine phosphate synthase [Bacteroidales bacterium]|nr:thiamine phosphate synthase [Bacteroidales bacterium]
MVPVQFITHTAPGIDYEASAMLALEGGCQWIQLRMKQAADSEVEPIARRLLAACREHGATFIIDDRVELAKAIEADGVHLGQHDMPVQEAREFLGHGFIIGGTANTLDDVRRLHRASADYIGAGPFRFTTTKESLAPVLGLEGYTQLVAGMEAEHIRLPLCAIGGITLADIPALLATGVKGVAVSGAVLRADNPADMMRRMLAADE